MALIVVAVLFLGAWTGWCVQIARRSGPGAAALTAVPLIVVGLLVIQAGIRLSLINFFGEAPSTAEVRRAVVGSAAAGLVATVAVASLAAWVRRADADDARSRSLLVGSAVAVALWSGSCSAMLGS